MLIDGILAYIDSQGAPPIDQDELCKALPASKISADASNVDGWRYERLGTGFTLRKKLGWDPSLTYHFDGTSDRWIYDPGDGGQASRFSYCNRVNSSNYSKSGAPGFAVLVPTSPLASTASSLAPTKCLWSLAHKAGSCSRKSGSQ